MALTIINALAATSGRLEKEAILKQNCENLTLKEAFRLALDPKVNFYIKKLPAAGPKHTGDPWSLDKGPISVEEWP
jgi:hypothetical protein